MSLPLFFSRFRLKALLPWLALSLLLGAAAVYAYTLAPLEALRYLRGEMAELFTVLGYVGDSNLPTFVLSYLYGFLLPALVSIYAAFLCRRLTARPLDDGRMAMLTAAPYRRAGILFTLWLVLALSLLLLILAAFLGQFAAAMVFFPGADLAALARLAAGFFLVSLLVASICFFLAALSPDEIRYGRRTRLILLLMLVLAMASRLPGWVQFLRYLSAWSLFEGTRLVFGAGGWVAAGAAGILGLALAGLSLWIFQQREL